MISTRWVSPPIRPHRVPKRSKVKSETEIRERIEQRRSEVKDEENNGRRGSEDWLLALAAIDELRWVLSE